MSAPGSDEAVVIEVLDNEKGNPKFWFGLLGGTIFPSLDASLSEANGWRRVKMSERNWQSLYGKYIHKSRLQLNGEPAALKPDGTRK